MTAPFAEPAGDAPTVSVIVASYNAESHLEAAIRSALAQTLADLEVLIVDDASTDASAEIARRLAAEDSRVRFARLARNGGPAAARNRALSLARGQWVAVLDSDDLYHPDRLRLLIQQAEADGADIVADDLLLFGDARRGPSRRHLGPRDRKERWIGLSEYLARTAAWAAQGDLGFLKPVIRKEKLDALGRGYDERLRIGEDDELIVRLLLAGASYRLLPSATYFYRQHEASITRSSDRKHLEAMIASSERMLADVRVQAPECVRACRRRLNARRRALNFEHLVGGIKARDWRAALNRASASPSPLPMLRYPVLNRLSRLQRVLWRSTSTAHSRRSDAGTTMPPVLFTAKATPANVLTLEWLIEEVWPMVRRSEPDAKLIVGGTLSRVLGERADGGPSAAVSPIREEHCIVIRPHVINSTPEGPEDLERMLMPAERPEQTSGSRIESSDPRVLAAQILEPLRGPGAARPATRTEVSVSQLEVAHG